MKCCVKNLQSLFVLLMPRTVNSRYFHIATSKYCRITTQVGPDPKKGETPAEYEQTFKITQPPAT